MSTDQSTSTQSTPAEISNETNSSQPSFEENTLIADFETPEEYLLYYARSGNVGKLYQLFDFIQNENVKLDIDAKGKHKSNRAWTALHLASYFGHLEVVKLLLEVSKAFSFFQKLFLFF